jgi:hypothetical protein
VSDIHEDLLIGAACSRSLGSQRPLATRTCARRASSWHAREGSGAATTTIILAAARSASSSTCCFRSKWSSVERLCADGRTRSVSFVPEIFGVNGVDGVGVLRVVPACQAACVTRATPTICADDPQNLYSIYSIYSIQTVADTQVQITRRVALQRESVTPRIPQIPQFCFSASAVYENVCKTCA